MHCGKEDAMKLGHVIGVIAGILLVSWAVGIVHAPGGFIDGLLVGGVGLCIAIMSVYRDVIVFRAEQVLGGFAGLDPLKVYKRLFVREDKGIKDPYLVVFRVVGEKAIYKMFTARTPPRYFKITDDGDVLPYLRQIQGGKKVFPVPAKIYSFPGKHDPPA